MRETILVLDFGGPYRELLTRKIRELNVYAQILPGNVSEERIREVNPIGIVFSGTPASGTCFAGLNIPIMNSTDETSPKELYDEHLHQIDTEQSETALRNFLYKTCGAKGDYSLEGYIEEQLLQIRSNVGDKKVLLALSGGVDSSVCAALLSKAIPGQLTCVFVDHGLMRLHEGDEIEEVFSKHDLEFIRVNAAERFVGKLKGVLDPEEKRKIVGEEFIRVFEEEAKKLGRIPFLAQGTNYADVIESGGDFATIKSHHNVGGLPPNLDFDQLVEPLAGLFKNEIRKIGTLLGLPALLIDRQPFPGPGLALRVMGEVTFPKLETLRHADAIVREELDKLDPRPSQYFAVLTDTYSIGVKDGKRTYDPVLAIRAVTTQDFMTATYTPLSHDVLGRLAARISGEIAEVSRVVYDISSKPPGTIEWL